MVRDIPSTIAGPALGVSHAHLRDLRAAVLTDHLGERQGKMMFYGAAELLEMEVGFFLARHGLRRGAAFAVAREHARRIHAAVSPRASDADQFLLIIIDDRLRDGYSVQISDASAATMNDATAVLGINLRRLAGDLTARLQELLRSAG